MKSLLLAGAGALLLGACAKSPAALPDTADLQRAAAPSGPYRSLNYQSPFRGFENHTPRGPASWRGVNGQQQENH
ncbi:hypothetical protein VWZ88_18430 [Phaeobacter sp. JH20_36]|uniref:hypothetical protein n=1 Tax=Phaeobacter TaxID=302485 RepID=UPI0021A8E6AA|nr:hypothetical protein [Phaeobacter inhibens]UWR53204.1 hypothetical protein K4F84_00880 [Phaeobacter inhibens]UWR64836.1 hypothetical protein K4L02_00955 [Phaeobacter inhibens]UWR68766.1 hypothetical protein K4K95_00875 [Phaeobacter inhibens]UWR72695.1 hypothetical protein K4L00_00885 [Phaeobacter inhibens]UWR80966.1 hypothetical protein K4K97_03245 [Phaeobacter inhibens]